MATYFFFVSKKGNGGWYWGNGENIAKYVIISKNDKYKKSVKR